MKTFLWIIAGLYLSLYLGIGILGAVATFKVADRAPWWKYILIAVAGPPVVLYTVIKDSIKEKGA